MKLAQRIAGLGTEAAFNVLTQAQALEARGMDIIHLEIGEPDFATHQEICLAAGEALRKGYTHYCNPQGITPLRAEIAAELKKTYGIEVNPERIMVTPGAKPVIFYSALALLEAGDEAIYPDPGFPIFSSMISFSGARPVPLPMREELSFHPDIDELKKKITARTRLIILNSPHNPTGSVLTEEEVRAIADIVREHDLLVLSDEVYDHIVYDVKPFSFARVPGMLDRTILLNGFSKTFAMTGWRLGYSVMPEKLIEPVKRLIINSVSCTPPFIQHAGIEALKMANSSVSNMVAEFRKRRDLIVKGLNEIPGFSCHLPQGAFYVFPNVKNTGMTSRQLASYLLNEAGVAGIAGADFGKYGEGYLRLSYAASIATIEKALSRIKKALSKRQRPGS
jgi:aspartate aminotransferase